MIFLHIDETTRPNNTEDKKRRIFKNIDTWPCKQARYS